MKLRVMVEPGTMLLAFVPSIAEVMMRGGNADTGRGMLVDGQETMIPEARVKTWLRSSGVYESMDEMPYSSERMNLICSHLVSSGPGVALPDGVLNPCGLASLSSEDGSCHKEKILKMKEVR